MKENNTQRPIGPRLIDFSVAVLKLVDQMPKTPVAIHLAGQLVKSGTSPALNYPEAQGAESRKDFIHKMSICLKELRETNACLQIISRTGLIPSEKMAQELKESDELVSIFVTSLKTAKSRR